MDPEILRGSLETLFRKLKWTDLFIAGSSKCTTKQLSSLLTKILTVIKTGLEKYCSIKTSDTGINNMWILKILQIYCHH